MGERSGVPGSERHGEKRRIETRSLLLLSKIARPSRTQKKTEGTERFRYSPLGESVKQNSSKLGDGVIRRDEAIEIRQDDMPG